MAARYPHGAWILLSGLACFLILLAGVTTWFVALSLAPVEMGPSRDEDLLTGVILGAGLGFLMLLTLILILFGLGRMRMTYPQVGPRTSWRIGPVRLTPNRISAVLVVVGLLSLLASFVNFYAGGPSTYSGAPSIVGRSVLLTLGTFLMVVSAEALRPLVSLREERLVFAAALAALFGGLLLTGSGVVTFLSGHETPPFLPWASVPAGLSGTFALTLLVLIAWRVAMRWERGAGVVQSDVFG